MGQVCFSESPSLLRVLTIREIMNHFHLNELCNATFVLQAILDGCQNEMARADIAPGFVLDEEWFGNFMESAGNLKTVCDRVSFRDTANVIEFSLMQAQTIKHRFNFSSLEAELTHIFTTLLLEMGKRGFLQIKADRIEYLDRDHLFGRQVSIAFTSAKGDIKEAGNCLAAECNTAAVFHLMRAAEFGLRALANDREIEFKDKPLEHKEWGQILPALGTHVTELRARKAKDWKSPFVRDNQIRYYNEIIQELRSFNEAWRRHLSHADTEAFYDRDEAASIMTHVGLFMQKLSIHISEHSRTPFIWES
jgi:hypothetical protein